MELLGLGTLPESGFLALPHFYQTIRALSRSMKAHFCSHALIQKVLWCPEPQ